MRRSEATGLCSALCPQPALSMRRRGATGLCFCSVLSAVVSSLLSALCGAETLPFCALLYAHSQLYAAQIRHWSLLLLCAQCCKFIASSVAAQRRYRPLLLLCAQCYFSSLCFKSQVQFIGRLLSALCYQLCAICSVLSVLCYLHSAGPSALCSISLSALYYLH
jgi:hypothetical protein